MRKKSSIVKLFRKVLWKKNRKSQISWGIVRVELTPRPYLIRALYEWIVDNNSTPYLLVHADTKGVDVPLEFVNEGRIVLNIAQGA
ncbi:MAG: hypothetical protein COB50_04180, partial [Thiotrichales bacterium]